MYKLHVFLVAAVGLAMLAVAATPASACPWDRTTLLAESSSMPCADAAALGLIIGQSEAALTLSLEAAQARLAWLPSDVDALDDQTNAYLRLGKLDLARASADKRLATTPSAYRALANAGTVLTFIGDAPRALDAVTRALTLEPNAHFGREHVHKQLLEFLVRARPATLTDFRGVAFSLDKPTTPSRDAAEALAALVAMVSVYGANHSPEIAFALGNAAFAAGKPKLAYLAYHRAIKLKFRDAQALRVGLRELAPIAFPSNEDVYGREISKGRPTVRDLNSLIDILDTEYKRKLARVHAWEQTQIARNRQHQAWNNTGYAAFADRAMVEGLRCATESGIGGGQGKPLPMAASPSTPSALAARITPLVAKMAKGCQGLSAVAAEVAKGGTMTAADRDVVTKLVDWQMQCRRSTAAKALLAALRAQAAGPGHES